MPSFDQFQERFSQIADTMEDKNQPSSLTVEGDSLEECLEKAADQLRILVEDLDYDMVQKGSKGVFGVGKRPFIIEVFFKSEADSTTPEPDPLEKAISEEQKSPDGQARVIIRKSGVFLKVTKPQKGGSKVQMDDVFTLLAQRNLKGLDKVVIKKIVDESSGEEIQVGEWRPNPEWDQKATIDIDADEMRATLYLSRPILSGRILEVDEIFEKLREQNIVFGLKEENIKEALDREVFEVSITIAEGKEVIHGKNAYIDYRFRVDHSDIILSEDEDSGRVDFKEHSSIQNVVQGQVLAIKVPATQGTEGRTVTNKIVEVKNGEDCNLQAGDNVQISEDGLQVIAQSNGQAILERSVIKVEPVLTVEHVNLDSGNITFLGSVIVKGDVQDGFSVTASADIEVRGNVGKAQLEASHDIIIKQGVNGKNEAVIKAGNNVYAKFIESANIIAENDVVVRENIMTSMVDAGARVICNGKKAFIIAGRTRACQEIYTKNLGNDAYAHTVVEAGIDPKSLEKLQALEQELTQNEEMLHKITINIKALYKMKEENKLTEKHEKNMDRWKKLKAELEINIDELESDIEDLNNYLTNLDTKGMISVRNIVYPGVDITIKEANLRVKNEFKSVSFVNESGYIKPLPFVELEDAALEATLKELKMGGGSSSRQ